MTNDTSPPEKQIVCRACGEEWVDMPFEHFCDASVTVAEYPGGPYGVEMTANEAGARGPDGTLDADYVAEEAVMEKIFTPSKPCTEGGAHCFCVADWSATMQVWNECARCCWCNVYVPYSERPVPGHGPYKTVIVRDDAKDSSREVLDEG